LSWRLSGRIGRGGHRDGIREVDRYLHEIANRIRRWRGEERLTLQQAAQRSGVAASTIQKVESQQMVPTITVLFKIARGLGRSPVELLESVTGEQGLLRGLRGDGIHIGTTTVSPGCASRLAELHAAHGSHYIAGPVVGRPDAAEAAELRTFTAGDEQVTARCEALFRAYAEAAIRVGAEHAVANSLKIAINRRLRSGALDDFGRAVVQRPTAAPAGRVPAPCWVS